jgi:hypothetical protein
MTPEDWRRVKDVPERARGLGPDPLPMIEVPNNREFDPQSTQVARAVASRDQPTGATRALGGQGRVRRREGLPRSSFARGQRGTDRHLARRVAACGRTRAREGISGSG